MRRPHLGLLAILFASALLASQCGNALSNSVIADVSVGPFTYSIAASQIMVPSQFVDSATNTIRSISCTDTSMCPQLGAGQPAVHCTNSVCTPDPFPINLASNVLDLDSDATVRQYGSNVMVLEVRAVYFTAMAAGLGNPVGPTELFWGPSTATDMNSPGVGHVGTIPLVQLPPDITTAMPIQLDTSGVADLSQYLLHTSHQMRLFARPSISLVPGGPVPTGNVTLQVQMQVHIEGQLVR
jgi:hypothetical protein